MHNNINLFKISFTLVLCVLLSACYGPRLNKHNPQANQSVAPTIATTRDDAIKIDLQFLLVRNSARSWAKDAKWDEYIFNISNLIDDEVIIENISIVDSLGYALDPQTTRKKLNKATKKTKQRFKKAGIKIKLGNGSSHMLTKSISGTVVGAGIGAGIASGGGVTMTAGTLTTAGGAVFVAVPAALVGGIVKIVNNSKVNNKIKKRQTTLPVDINGNSSNLIDLFYSAIPSPEKIIINYSINNQKYKLKLVLPESFNGLHYK